MGADTGLAEVSGTQSLRALFRQLSSLIKHYPLCPHHLGEGTAAWSWGRNHLKISLRILKLPGWKPVTAASHFSNLPEDPVLPGVYFESVLQGRAQVSQVTWP